MRFESDPIPMFNLNDHGTAARDCDHIYFVWLPARTDAVHKICKDVDPTVAWCSFDAPFHRAESRFLASISECSTDNMLNSQLTLQTCSLFNTALSYTQD